MCPTIRLRWWKFVLFKFLRRLVGPQVSLIKQLVFLVEVSEDVGLITLNLSEFSKYNTQSKN